MTKAKPEKADIEDESNNLLTQDTDYPVDRPGCDFGGSNGLVTADLGLGLTGESLNSRLPRSPPRRRLLGTLRLS